MLIAPSTWSFFVATGHWIGRARTRGAAALAVTMRWDAVELSAWWLSVSYQSRTAGALRIQALFGVPDCLHGRLPQKPPRYTGGMKLAVIGRLGGGEEAVATGVGTSAPGVDGTVVVVNVPVSRDERCGGASASTKK